MRLAIGHTLLFKTIKSGTISQYTLAGARFVQAGRKRENPNQTYLDPRLDMITNQKTPDIKAIEHEVARWENMPNRKKAFTKDEVHA